MDRVDRSRMVVVCMLVGVAVDGFECIEFMVMAAVDEDNAGAVTIDMKLFGVNHDRYVLTMEAADKGVVQDGAAWVRMEAEAIRFRNMVMVGENYLSMVCVQRRRAAGGGYGRMTARMDSVIGSPPVPPDFRFHRW